MNSSETINKAELVKIGDLKESEYWKNIYLQFKLPTGELRWFYYSEHKDKPYRLQQIRRLFDKTIIIGMLMTVNFKIVQSPNKSTKLQIINLANYTL